MHTLAEEERQEMAGMQACKERQTTAAWQKMWLKHEMVAQQSLVIGVESSSAQWPLKFGTYFAPKHAAGRAE